MPKIYQKVDTTNNKYSHGSLHTIACDRKTLQKCRDGMYRTEVCKKPVGARSDLATSWLGDEASQRFAMEKKVIDERLIFMKGAKSVHEALKVSAIDALSTISRAAGETIPWVNFKVKPQ